MAWVALRAMIRKDLLLFLRDRRAVIMSFVAPIAIASFFGFIFAGVGGDRGKAAARLPVRAIDQDRSAISQGVLKGLSADPTLEVQGGTLEEAVAAVRRGQATVAVVLPAGFGEAAERALFRAGEKPKLDLHYDPSRALEMALVRGILTQAVMRAVSTSGLGGGGPTAPYTVDEHPVTARAGVQYNSYAHSFAGMGVQFLLLAGIDLAVGMLLERQLGLWKRIRAAPLSRYVILCAKATSGAVIAVVTLFVTFAFGIVVFGIRIQGSAVGFAAVCLATAAMASSFGLMVASLGRTPQVTRAVANLAVLLMVMLGGAWVPSFVFPAWLQKLTLVVPARWAIDGLDATTWRGVGLVGVLPAVGVLLGSAVVFGAVALARFRWEAE
jgi:ABC-2 type transport system permease protein